MCNVIRTSAYIYFEPEVKKSYILGHEVIDLEFSF